MIASDPIRTLRHLLQAGGRPHMDSGLAPCGAPRNDGGEIGVRRSRHALTAHLAQPARTGPLMNLVVRNARLRGLDQLVDIGIDNGKIAAVGPKLAAKAQHELDAAGSLVLPGLFNLHFHSDKCLLGEVMRPNLSGTLPEAIEITNDFKRKYDPKEVAARTLRVLETGVKNGTTFFRLFADVGTIGRLEGARGLLLAREQ